MTELYRMIELFSQIPSKLEEEAENETSLAECEICGRGIYQCDKYIRIVGDDKILLCSRDCFLDYAENNIFFYNKEA